MTETEAIQYILEIDLTDLYGMLDTINNILVVILIGLGLCFGALLLLNFRK